MDKYLHSEKSDNEISDNEGGVLNLLHHERDYLKRSLMQNLEIMKKSFKKNGLQFEDLLDKNQFLNFLDKNMEAGKIFDRYAASKIFSVLEWSPDERISVYFQYFYVNL